jgi:hypothetical protein
MMMVSSKKCIACLNDVLKDSYDQRKDVFGSAFIVTEATLAIIICSVSFIYFIIFFDKKRVFNGGECRSFIGDKIREFSARTGSYILVRCCNDVRLADMT